MIKVLLLALLLCGCSVSGMTNDQIITESNKCSSAGFDISVMRYLGNGEIIAIECLPKNYHGDHRVNK